MPARNLDINWRQAKLMIIFLIFNLERIELIAGLAGCCCIDVPQYSQKLTPRRLEKPHAGHAWPGAGFAFRDSPQSSQKITPGRLVKLQTGHTSNFMALRYTPQDSQYAMPERTGRLQRGHVSRLDAGDFLVAGAGLLRGDGLDFIGGGALTTGAGVGAGTEGVCCWGAGRVSITGAGSG